MKSKLVLLLMVMVLIFSSFIIVQAANEPQFLAVGTAGTGGAYYPIGIAMAEILQNNLGINTTAQITGGAVENNGLIENCDVDIAITMGPMAYAAVNGTDPYAKKHENVKALFSGLTSGVFQIVVNKNSDIQSIYDLKGKRVVLGPAGGGGINVTNDVFKFYGMSFRDIQATYIAYQEGMTELLDGKIDAVILQTAIPSPAIAQFASQKDSYRFVDIEEDKIKEISDAFPYYAKIVLDEEVYGTESRINTVYSSNMVTVRNDLSEELVYDITKALFDNLEKVKNSHPAANGMTIEKSVQSPIDFHSGAEKYFKEIGAL